MANEILSDDVDQHGRRIPFDGYEAGVITKESRLVIGLQMDGGFHHVGSDGVTTIEPYDEYGQMSYVPWFNVWRGKVFYCKINDAHVVSVLYKQPDTDVF